MEKQRIESLIVGKWKVVLLRNMAIQLGMIITYEFKDSEELCNTSQNHLIEGCDGVKKVYKIVAEGEDYFIRTEAFSKQIAAISETYMLWKIEGFYYVLHRIS